MRLFSASEYQEIFPIEFAILVETFGKPNKGHCLGWGNGGHGHWCAYGVLYNNGWKPFQKGSKNPAVLSFEQALARLHQFKEKYDGLHKSTGRLPD